MEPSQPKYPEGYISARDLPELAPLMEQASNAVRARHVSLEDFFRLFDQDVHGKIRGAALADGATHVVCFENLDMWSSQAGARTALVVGAKQTYTLEQILRKPFSRLGDVPSRFQYPVAYADIATLREQLPGQQEPKLDIKAYGG